MTTFKTNVSGQDDSFPISGFRDYRQSGYREPVVRLIRLKAVGGFQGGAPRGVWLHSAEVAGLETEEGEGLERFLGARGQRNTALTTHGHSKNRASDLTLRAESLGKMPSDVPSTAFPKVRVCNSSENARYAGAALTLVIRRLQLHQFR
jgi:hypothetical protein